MAILNKDQNLRAIASSVMHDNICFERDMRPAFLMGGKEVYIANVYFNYDSGDICYGLVDKNDISLTSSRGERRVAELPGKVLSDLADKCDKYIETMLNTLANDYRLSSRVREAAKNRKMRYSPRMN